MRTLSLSFACLAIVAAALGAVVQEGPPPAPATAPEHAWLKQLVGEWNVVVEASMGPDAEPMRMESTESARMIGDLWLVAEGRAEIGGVAMRSMLTIGFDPAQNAFVGTWIDSMQTHMWLYRGTLDDARKVLSLESEGPGFDDPTKTATYRDAIEIVDADTKVLTSAVRNPDGSWTSFMRAEYRRKK